MSSTTPRKAKGKAKHEGKTKGKKTKSPEDEEKLGHPEDIFPMVLTSATQELFSCRTDEDVTVEHPHKFLQKEDIIQDMKTRAAVSDFSPVKQIVLDYPEDEMLLVFDRDFTFGQCFYLALTPEAKERILNPPEPETPDELEGEVSTAPGPKQWTSHITEQEIEKESVKETCEKLCVRFSRVRRKFGAPVKFSDSDVFFTECPSDKDRRCRIKQMQRDCSIQAVPKLQSSSAQTEWKIKKNAFTQYEPRELSDEESKKILNSEDLKKFLNIVNPRVLHALQQSEIMDVFMDDWKALGAGAEDDDYSGQVTESLMVFKTFSDQTYTKGMKIRCVMWHPTINGVLAVAMTEIQESTNFDVRPSHILFYSFADTSGAKLLLECPDDIYAFEFCPTDPNIIVGGCVNGQVVLWDISAYITCLQGAQPAVKRSLVNTDIFDLEDNKEKIPSVCYCALSSVESSHKAVITDVQWLPPTFEVTKTGATVENKNKLSVQIVTCSPDCSIMFWDIRVTKLLSLPTTSKKQKSDWKSLPPSFYVPETFKHLDGTWRPLFKVSLPKIDTSGEYAPLKFSLEPYTSYDNNTGGTTAETGNGSSSEVRPDYSQLRAPSAKTLAPLEDINTKLIIGTEDGSIVCADWKLGRDTGRLHCEKPLSSSRVHHRLVNTVQRSPFFKDMILTVGAWNFAIWREEILDTPIIKSPYSEPGYTAGCWSLSKAAVFFIGREDGSIEIWNLLEKSGTPVHVNLHITKARISCMKPWTSITSKQHFLTVCDEVAVVHLLRIPRALCTPSRSERLNLKKYFQLEEERLKDLQMRKDAWLKEAKEAEEANEKTEPPRETLEERKERHEKAYEDYLLLEEKVLKELGVWKEPKDK